MKFRLVRYFTLASAAAFLAVVIVLGLVQRGIAIDNMIDLEESNNVNLTKTFANSLWRDFDPFVAAAGQMDVEALRGSPVQRSLYDKVERMMRGLSVVKVKVYDLEGLTVFSTQASQIGEDKSSNEGFLRARAGIAASELTHRDSFSAFEETVENLDVLSSYIPIRDPDTHEVKGVFEIYSDVTPFLAEIGRMTWTVVGTVVAVLVVLFAVLSLVIKRADAIIRNQAEENTRAQLQIAQAEKMASLGQMVAGVAHELNTPLAFTRSNVSMLQEIMEELQLPLECGSQMIRQVLSMDGDLVNLRVRLNRRIRERMGSFDDELNAEQIQQMLRDTLNGLEQMSELVVHLREFTRLDRAKVAEYDINRAVGNVIYIARSALSEKVVIETELGAIPPLQCMPSQMNQILINLINNAAHAVEDREDGRVIVRTEELDGCIRIHVEDNGHGIPAEIRERIFEPYFTTKETGKGTGLGLSIVRDIVLSHAGTIEVDSAPGEGTRFTLSIPLDAQIEQAIAA